MKQQAVTANLLGDGRVVFATWDGDWSENVTDSHVTSSEEEAEWLLETAKRAVTAQVVVDPYLIDVDTATGFAWPVRYREQIRAAGPTIAYAHDPAPTTLRRVA